MGQHSADTETEFEGAPPKTERKYLKPFGMDPQRNMMMRDEALRTMSREECFARGYISVKDLDDEELRYGRARDINGNIPNKNGKRTQLIPRERYDEMVAEHELRFKQKLRQRLDDMIDVMTDIALDDTVEPRERFEAAKYIFERTAGKTPETVTVNVKHAPWEELLSQVAGIAPMSRAEHRQLQAGIVDAELVEITDDDELQSTGPNDVAEGEQDATMDSSTMGDVGSTIHHGASYPAESVSGHLSAEDYFVEGDIRHRVDVSLQSDARLEQHMAEQRADSPSEPERNYGRRADERRSYAEQAHDAQDLQKRRKAARERIQGAKKQRKIARALGADAIKDEITGATVADDGTVTFEQGE